MHSGFEQYVRARGEALCRFAHLLCGDRHLGEDLVQEVLVKAHRRWASIEAEQPDSYLRTALVRSHISWLRRRSSGERPSAEPARAAVLGDFADQHAAREDMWGLLAGLTRTQRAVLVLRYYEDLDDRQIAEILRSSPSTVRVHAARGLARLRADLTPPTLKPGASL
ncbi:SigE family RNA polymerase sigma factor [Amorphoplanes digitatis]|uniref:RNA polymerase sigma-70 factor (Sigma-E family) n=1 Tax=Actinoplanes digitatis TaxID=1868 RepID=A0A7W7MS30_9ACTN|nr:SigE family RNA polymerase sigma factor [Actinoplanes digitatis]MBB4764104.1 RNA polymerase sigma-70 factor (sigma-E family) [Actinoplanes digitatis]GID97382.1 RNA polymerase [Actinoplanes digitatis]